jgi:DNA-binding transcriptional LysR family regulator
MPVTLRQLEIFTAVATERSLTSAAGKLHISQSSISRHLRDLEDDFGEELYRRAESGIELTGAGRTLFQHATRILSRIEAAKINIRGKFAEANPSSLTIGGSYTAATRYLPFVLRRFQYSHPNVMLHLRTNNGWVLARLVLTGEVDVALVHSRPRHRQIAMELFSVDPAGVYVAQDHPLARKKRPSLSEMNATGFILPNSPSKRGVTSRFFNLLKRKGMKPKVVMRCDSEEAKMAAVKSSLGIGLGFRAGIEAEMKRGELVELPLSGLRLSGNSYMIYHKKRPLSRAGLEFIELLRKYRLEEMQIP